MSADRLKPLGLADVNVGSCWQAHDGEWTVTSVTAGDKFADVMVVLENPVHGSRTRCFHDVIDEHFDTLEEQEQKAAETAIANVDVRNVLRREPLALALKRLTKKQRKEYERKVDDLRALAGTPTVGATVKRHRDIAAQQNVTAALPIVAKAWGVSKETVRKAFVAFRDHGDTSPILWSVGARLESEYVVYSRFTAIVVDVIINHVTGLTRDGSVDVGANGRARQGSRVPATILRPRVDAEVLRQQREGTPVTLPSEAKQQQILSEMMHIYGVAGNSAMKFVATSLARPAGRPQPRPQLLPGEQVEVDSTRLDVRLRDPVTGEVHESCELLAMVDRASRSLLALVVVPGAATAADVAALLFAAMSPKSSTRRLTSEERSRYDWITQDDVDLWGETVYRPEQGCVDFYGLPYLFIQEIIADHGKIFTSCLVRTILQQMRISLALTRTYSPWDKPFIERFFGYLKTSLLAYLAGFTGGSVADRGGNLPVEHTPREVQELLLGFAAAIHQNHTIRGFRMPGMGDQDLTPNQALRAAAAQGALQVPAYDRNLVFQFLEPTTASIDHTGTVTIRGNKFKSEATQARIRKEPPTPRGWDFYRNRNDIRAVWLVDPELPYPLLVGNVDLADAPRPLTETMLNQVRKSVAGTGLTGKDAHAEVVKMLTAHGALREVPTQQQRDLDRERDDQSTYPLPADDAVDDTEDPVREDSNHDCDYVDDLESDYFNEAGVA